MDYSSRRARYRGILEGDVCVHPGSVFDPISARIAEDLGFEVGMFAGSIASFTVLGAPDLVVLTLTEFAQQIHRICRAGDLSLMVDADHGYGNALNVMRTVEELETAGVSALTIEDTVLPRSFGQGRTQLLTVEEGVGKMKAALAARTDPALCIAGRTGSLRVTSVEDTITRVKAYEAAGVDAIFLAGASTKEEVATVGADFQRVQYGSPASGRAGGAPSMAECLPIRIRSGAGRGNPAFSQAFATSSRTSRSSFLLRCRSSTIGVTLAQTFAVAT